MRKRRATQLDWVKENARYWREVIERNGHVEKGLHLKANEDFSDYQLMMGPKCVYAWKAEDPGGDTLAHYLSHHLIAPLRAAAVLLAPKSLSKEFKRPARYRPFILEELARLQGNARGAPLIRLVHENTKRHLKELERKGRLPDGLKASVSRTYVAKVISEGYSKAVT